MVSNSLKAKPLKFHPFELINQWGVTATHGIKLHIDKSPFAYWHDGMSLDVEDDEQGNFVGLGVYLPNTNECYYISELRYIEKEILPKFIAHNGISDIRKLQKWGFKIDESWLIWDTQLMGHIVDSSLRTYGLKDMVKRDLGFEYPSYESICGKKTSKGHKTLKDFPAEHVAAYNGCDTYYTYKLAIKQGFHQDRGVFPPYEYFEKIEQPVSVVFHSMQEKGILLDLPYLRTLEATLSSKRDVIEKEIKNELGDINLNSPKQLLEALHAKDIRPELKGKGSTDKRALERHSRTPIVSKLLAFSELETLLSSFVLPYLARASETVNPNYLQTGTRTGRPSCSNPNLLQIPRKTENGKLVRRMFIPREGNVFGELDYGQIEPRILAHLSRDSALSEMFRRGINFHTYTAERLTVSRERAKVLNLSVGYRATFKSVSAQLKCTEQEAQKQIDAWWEAFPALKAWQTKLIWQSKKDGYFTTLMGRRIKVDNLDEWNKWKREAAERQLINNIAQASATEVMKLGMIAVHKAGINILVQVYDSLLIEDKSEKIEATASRTARFMKGAVKLDIPLTVDIKIGNNWAFQGAGNG